MDLDSFGKEAMSILCLDAGGHNNLASLPPVYRGGNLPPGGQLEAVNGTDDLVKVPASGGWVEDGELQLLVWANHKHSSASKWHTSIVLGHRIQHGVFHGNFSGGISNDGIVEVSKTIVSLDVSNPAIVSLNFITR